MRGSSGCARRASGRRSAGRRWDCSRSTCSRRSTRRSSSPMPSRPWRRTSGADEGTLGQIAAGFMVICIAPVAEEFFFRGLLLPRAPQPLLGTRGRADRRPPVRRDPLGLLERRCAPDRAAACGARVHVLPRLRAHGLALSRDRAPRAQQCDRVRGDDRGPGDLAGARSADAARLRACARAQRQRAAMA